MSLIRPFRSPQALKVARRGAVLFIAVGAISVLSILALGATSSVMQELRLSRFVAEANTSFYPVVSIAQAMRIVLSNDAVPSAVTAFDLRDRAIPFGDKVVKVSFTDEQGKINLRTAGVRVLSGISGIKRIQGMAQQIVSADIFAKEDLLLLEGMIPENYERMKHNITVFGDGALNINTAGDRPLAALFGDQDLADKVIQFRNGDDREENTGDDRSFAFAAEIVPLLEASLTEPQKAFLEGLVSSGQLTVGSDYISMDITLTRADKPLKFFQIILQLSTGRIGSWNES